MCDGQGFRATLVKIYVREFCWVRLTEEWIYIYLTKNKSVGVMGWRTSMSQIRFNCSWFEWWCYGWLIAHFLRCERELELRWQPQGQREPLLERQRVERRESASHRGSETYHFSYHVVVGVLSTGCLLVGLLLVVVWSPFFQPPSILPTSSSFSESIVYFSVGINLFSQAIWQKNFKISTLDMILPNSNILGSGGRYMQEKLSSRIFRNVLSIFWPRPSRSMRGRLRYIANQYWYTSFSFKITAGTVRGGA